MSFDVQQGRIEVSLAESGKIDGDLHAAVKIGAQTTHFQIEELPSGVPFFVDPQFPGAAEAAQQGSGGYGGLHDTAFSTLKRGLNLLHDVLLDSAAVDLKGIALVSLTADFDFCQLFDGRGSGQVGQEISVGGAHC